MTSLFDTVLTNLRRLGIEPPITYHQPQKRPTSFKMRPLYGYPVRLLVGPLVLPPVYTKKGDLAKRQPHPMKVGDIAYAKLQPDGGIRLYPFDLAGSGYELPHGEPIIDAEEGVHFAYAGHED